MANAVVTIKIMPTSPDVDLTALEIQIKEKIAKFCGETQTKTEIEPIAFGLKAIKILFVMDESKGSTEPLELEVQGLENVQSAEITDIRRALG